MQSPRIRPVHTSCKAGNTRPCLCLQKCKMHHGLGIFQLHREGSWHIEYPEDSYSSTMHNNLGYKQSTSCKQYPKSRYTWKQHTSRFPGTASNPSKLCHGIHTKSTNNNRTPRTDFPYKLCSSYKQYLE